MPRVEVIDLVLDHVGNVERIVRRRCVGTLKLDPFARVAQAVVRIAQDHNFRANGVSGAESGELGRITRIERGNHQRLLSIDYCAGCEVVVESLAQPPASQVNGPRRGVVNLDEFQLVRVVVADRVVHHLADDDLLGWTRAAVVVAQGSGDHRIEITFTIGPKPERLAFQGRTELDVIGKPQRAAVARIQQQPHILAAGAVEREVLVDRRIGPAKLDLLVVEHHTRLVVMALAEDDVSSGGDDRVGGNLELEVVFTRIAQPPSADIDIFGRRVVQLDGID